MSGRPRSGSRLLDGALLAGAMVACVAASPLALAGATGDSWLDATIGGFGARPVSGLLAGAALALPLGELAGRVGLGAALLQALAALLSAVAVRRAAPADAHAAGAVGGAAAAALLALRGPVTIAEAGSAAALALLVLAGQRPAAGARLALFLIASVALGLGAAAFAPVVVALAVLAVFAWRAGARWPLLAPLALALGMLPLLAPALAGAGRGLPPPSVTALLGELVPGDAFTPATLAAVLVRAGAADERVGMPALLLALAGLVAALRARAPAALLWLAALAGGLRASGAGDPAVAGILGAALAMALGGGVVATARALVGAASAARPTRGALLAVAASAAVIALVPSLLERATPAALRMTAPAAGGFARAALATAPARALLLARRGGLGPCITYEVEAAGARPDVTLLLRDALDDGAGDRRLRRAVERAGGGALDRASLDGWTRRGRWARRDAGVLLEQAVARALGHGGKGVRAVRWEAPSADGGAPADVPPLGVLIAAAPLLRVEGVPVPPMPVRDLADVVERLAAGSVDPVARNAAADTLAALGALWLSGDARRAAALFEAALVYRPAAAGAALGLARALAQRQQPERALAIAQRLQARRPDRLDVGLAVAGFHVALGDLAAAEREYRAAARAQAAEVAPLCGLARVAHARGDLDGARSFVEQALARAPADAEARELAARYRVR